MPDRIEELHTRLQRGDIVILDGAFGTELMRRGVSTQLPLWSGSAIVSDPAICQQIHHDYIEAGADVITTNTFRTNPRVCSKDESLPDFETLTALACAQANSARASTGRADVLIAGCMAPVEDCYEPDLVPSNADLKKEHSALANVLESCDIDFLFCETFNTIREAEHALSAACDTGLPVAISFVCTPEGKLLSQEPLEDACKMAIEFDPLYVSVNCAPPELIHRSVRILQQSCDIPYGVYANGIGRPSEDCGWVFPDSKDSPEKYLTHAVEWAEIGATLIGGCCGTTPEYIQALRKRFPANR